MNGAGRVKQASAPADSTAVRSASSAVAAITKTRERGAVAANRAAHAAGGPVQSSTIA